MTTITIQFEDTTKLQKILNFIKGLKVPFQIVDSKAEAETLWEAQSDEDLVIKERLRAKYVTSGQWASMSLDEKEDATLLETMLYDREKGVELLTPTEQTAFLNELRDLAQTPEYAL